MGRPGRRQIQLGLAAFGLAVWVYQLLACAVSVRASVWSLPTVLAAMYLADAASGVVHFIVDYTPNATGVGLKELFEYEGKKGSQDYISQRAAAIKRISGFEEVVFDFKVHHLTPAALGRRSVVKMTLPVIVFATMPLTVVIAILSETGQLPAHLALFLLVLIACATVSQYAHACTHRRSAPPVVRILQSCHLFLTPTQHHAHHVRPNRSFCLLNGWANPLVDRIFHWLQARGHFPDEGLLVR